MANCFYYLANQEGDVINRRGLRFVGQIYMYYIYVWLGIHKHFINSLWLQLRNYELYVLLKFQFSAFAFHDTRAVLLYLYSSAKIYYPSNLCKVSNPFLSYTGIILSVLFKNRKTCVCTINLQFTSHFLAFLSIPLNCWHQTSHQFMLAVKMLADFTHEAKAKY